jgi:hypothetical protein
MNKNYICSVCGASGVKLWRSYSCSCVELKCCDCAAKDQHKNISSIGQDGRYEDSSGLVSDSIGWYVPAVPSIEGDSYWGYTSVPAGDLFWWKSLPLRPEGLPLYTITIHYIVMFDDNSGSSLLENTKTSIVASFVSEDLANKFVKEKNARFVSLKHKNGNPWYNYYMQKVYNFS